ncbi:hypothetical protein K440DRAFT_523519, partial [Wilcoxina mikolae CBS 423.85]
WIIQKAHHSASRGHFRSQRFTELVARELSWKGLAQNVMRYIRGYSACHRAKKSNEKPYSLIQPL